MPHYEYERTHHPVPHTHRPFRVIGAVPSLPEGELRLPVGGNHVGQVAAGSGVSVRIRGGAGRAHCPGRVLAVTRGVGVEGRGVKGRALRPPRAPSPRPMPPKHATIASWSIEGGAGWVRGGRGAPSQLGP